MATDNETVDKETRQERREQRLKKKRERMLQHGRKPGQNIQGGGS